MEVVELADRTEADETGAEVLVVARGQQPATALAEAHDPRRVAGREPVAGVDGHQPELVVVERVEHAQHRVVGRFVAVAGRHLVASACHLVGEEREPPDVPVVGDVHDGRLQQDVRHRVSMAEHRWRHPPRSRRIAPAAVFHAVA